MGHLNSRGQVPLLRVAFLPVGVGLFFTSYHKAADYLSFSSGKRLGFYNWHPIGVLIFLFTSDLCLRALIPGTRKRSLSISKVLTTFTKNQSMVEHVKEQYIFLTLFRTITITNTVIIYQPRRSISDLILSSKRENYMSRSVENYQPTLEATSFFSTSPTLPSITFNMIIIMFKKFPRIKKKACIPNKSH